MVKCGYHNAIATKWFNAGLIMFKRPINIQSKMVQYG